MRFLLTGGAGFIGSHTCVALLNAGHEVVVLDNYINSSPEALRRVEKSPESMSLYTKVTAAMKLIWIVYWIMSLLTQPFTLPVSRQSVNQFAFLSTTIATIWIRPSLCASVWLRMVSSGSFSPVPLLSTATSSRPCARICHWVSVPVPTHGRNG